MKLFLDTAVVDEVRSGFRSGLIDGVTTNPTLASAAAGPFVETIMAISEIVGPEGTVSVETVSTDTEGLVREARLVTSWASNIVAKIPCTLEGLRAVRVCSREGIRTNVTLVFSAAQGLLAMKAGALYVSPFVGRLDDTSMDGFDLIRDLVGIKRNYGFETEILVASIRGPQQVRQAAISGADIATMPLKVFQRLFEHPLTDKGIDRFLDDWRRLPAEFRPF